MDVMEPFLVFEGDYLMTLSVRMLHSFGRKEEWRIIKYFDVSSRYVTKSFPNRSPFPQASLNFLILGVCILLRVWDQGESVFPSTQL
jgi:hypothetical protein